jgi:hypothetical protein
LTSDLSLDSQLFFVAAYCLEHCTTTIQRLRDLTSQRCQRFIDILSTVHPVARRGVEQQLRIFRLNELALHAHLVRPQKCRDLLAYARLVLAFLLGEAGTA